MMLYWIILAIITTENHVSSLENRCQVTRPIQARIIVARINLALNNITTQTSLMIGSTPLWWTPRPRLRRS